MFVIVCFLIMFPFVVSKTGHRVSDYFEMQSAAVVYPRSFVKAAQLLVSEVYKRSLFAIEMIESGFLDNSTDHDVVIHLTDGAGEETSCRRAKFDLEEREGFEIYFENKSISSYSSTQRNLCVVGSKRGVLFGVGKLLRELKMGFSQSYSSIPTISYVLIDPKLNIISIPKYTMRGHMISYRAISNCYDGWSMENFEQYVRDLVVFGTNQIELVGVDGKNSPNFQVSQVEFIIRASEIINSYDLDMSIWDPITDDIFLKTILPKLKRLDSYFVPSGDPGSLSPSDFFNAVYQKSLIVHSHFPNCEIWISHQGFNVTELEEYTSILQHSKELSWLTGIVYGPHSRWTMKYAREVGIPSHFPLRHYPDIGHGLKSEFPNPFWKTDYAFTEAREAINPRPVQMENIIKLTQLYTIGFSSYSDGCNDDLNKIIWSLLHWDPDMTSKDVVYDYVKYFFSSFPETESTFIDLAVESILDLERNWIGDGQSTSNPVETLKKWEYLDTHFASVSLKKNWRFQSYMYRSTFDAYLSQKSKFEKKKEETSLIILKRGLEGEISIDEAVFLANETLNEPLPSHTNNNLEKLKFYAGMLFQSIHMELSVSQYFASSIGRGANLDTANAPLNNIRYLAFQFDRIQHELHTHEEKMELVYEIVEWKNVPEGGFYVCPGEFIDPQKTIIEFGKGYELDPSFHESYLMGFQEPFDVSKVLVYPYTWYSYGQGLYDYPLKMKFDVSSLEMYKIRVVYGGDTFSTKIRLDANGVPVHGFIEKPNPLKILEFEIPQSAFFPNLKSKDDRVDLVLEWNVEPGRGGNGRGNQVAELWIIPY